ncbi:MAG: hydrogenase nickel incorporation protein HypB [bacterium]|nr:hydrogenase nickel incorporation protein HypB [bacterium]
MCHDCGCSQQKKSRVVELHQRILEKNDLEATRNRQVLSGRGIIGLNLMSSPGSGKTTLIEKTIDALGGGLRIAVIEGDLETDRDAERIRRKGVPVHQITTGQTCHLDAVMLHEAFHNIPLTDVDILFVENVGNLVCPAVYDIGTHVNVVLLSTTEGDDKPAKYPTVFRNSDVMLVTKIDLLPHNDFSISRARSDALAIHPHLQILELSSATGSGFDSWTEMLYKLHSEREAFVNT